MTNREAVNWIVNISADIGKREHKDLWHYEQALSEIKEMLESLPYVSDINGGDMISGEAAIDALCAVCGEDCDKSEFVYNAPQDEQVILCPEHYCLCTLPSAQPEQRWIPCSERLPSTGGIYLTTVHPDYVVPNCTSVDMLIWDEGKWWFFDFDGKRAEWDDPIIAWMPLPTPYRG